MIKKVLNKLIFGFIVFLLAMGANVIVFQFLYDDLQSVLNSSYISSFLAAIFVALLSDAEHTVEIRQQDDILDQD